MSSMKQGRYGMEHADGVSARLLRALRVGAGAALLLLPIAALSRVPVSGRAADDAVLRMSWRASVRMEEQCRDRTPEELAALPIHMRAPQVCEADDAAYALIVGIDDALPDTVHLLRGGVKGDRPLFVLEERHLPPGRHRVRVELVRLSGSGPAALVPPLDSILEFPRGHVVLVTTTAEGSAFEVR